MRKNTILFIILFILIFFISCEKEAEKYENGIILTDMKESGIPDILKLNRDDSQRFIEWFTSIIVSIANGDMQLPENENDCSGLIRYAYKEALKKHDHIWAQQVNFNGYMLNDVKAYNYPQIPFIGTKLFKINDKDFDDINNYSVYASARYLIEHNLDFVSKNINTARTGDIAAFFHPSDYEFPFHLMVLIKEKGINVVIYHTGPIDSNNKGEMRIVKVEDLVQADPSWMIHEKNRNFLGFYRFKILY